MSNVIPIGLPRRPNLAQRQALLVKNFALGRRPASDVYWLKENAELLNILVNCSVQLSPQALAPLEQFYEGLEERMRFFPQYYRFLLSMCLDLEELGMDGGIGEKLCTWVAERELPEAELSDLQRAEARYLLSRRDVAWKEDGLDARLDAFCHRSATFALPNKKAAYELSHIVFYKSSYGKRTLAKDETLIKSLEFAGLLAYLDQDVDLLAEICLALRFAGQNPSDVWEDWIAMQLHGFSFEPVQGRPGPDAYHEFLVTNWWSMHVNGTGFERISRDHGIAIVRHGGPIGPLRAMSERMYHLGSDRTANWPDMRRLLTDALGSEAHSILEGAERSSQRFDAFFEDFARAD